MIALIACVVAMVCYLFLPAISMLGQEITMMDIMTTDGFGGGEGSIYVIIPVLVGIVGVVGCLMKKKVVALVGGIGGAISVLFFVYKMADVMGVSFGDLAEYMDNGIWFSVIAFAVTAVVAAGIKKAE